MKLKAIVIAAVAVVLLGAGYFVWSSRGSSNEIAQMARNGAKEDELINIVEKSSGKYNLSPEDILAMKKDGVSDDVIIAMIRHNKGEVVAQPAKDNK
jgi:hypothetical protein